MIDVIVSVSDKYSWALLPFAYLFNKYWSPNQRVIVAGYTPPNAELPDNFYFHSIAQPQYGKEKWCDGLVEFLEIYDRSHFVLLLEDYWLCRPVDLRVIDLAYQYMLEHPEVLRFDLTADRLYANGVQDIGYYGYLDLISAPKSAYEMSLQAGIWNKQLLLDIIVSLPENRHSAWDLEIDGTTVVNHFSDTIKVVGTRQLPVRYANGMNNAMSNKVFYDRLIQEDIAEIKPMIPEDYK
jgi:hypothetical protein